MAMGKTPPPLWVWSAYLIPVERFKFLDFPILLPLYFCLYVKTRQALLIFSGILYMSYLHLSSKVFQMVKINSNLTKVSEIVRLSGRQTDRHVSNIQTGREI